MSWNGKYADFAMKSQKVVFCQSLKPVRLFKLLSCSNLVRTMSSVVSTGVLVKRDMTSCESNLCRSNVMSFKSSVDCSEFLHWCSVCPRRGLIMSITAFERLLVTVDGILNQSF